MQPLAFSKELLPVGSWRDGDRDRPRAVSEYLVERLVLGGADKICFVISPGKSDILEYYGGGVFSASVFYSVQPQASGLCDAVFCARRLIADDEQVMVGLPDTVWFPEDALRALPDDELSFLLFPVDRPQLFDAVVLDGTRVLEIQVKRPDARSNWIWGAFKMPGRTLHALHDLWQRRGRADEYIGTLINAWLEGGGSARGICAGEGYVDVGTVQGYREAIALLSGGTGSRAVALADRARR
jgi:dTDP-glucose pyrophosphorylase